MKKKTAGMKTASQAGSGKMGPFGFANALLKGMSQIMLQESCWTGLLFLLGILANSWVMFIGAAFGVASGTLAAMLLKYDKKDIGKGLYGFNGALVGISLFFFLVPDSAVLLLIAMGAVLSSIIMNFMHERKMSPYTFPFVLSAWAMLAIASATGWIAFQQQGSAPASDPLSSLSYSLAQVMFQQNVLTGLFFLCALIVSSRIAAGFALLGAAAGTLAAAILGFPLALAGIGIYGYNGVLCGIALSGSRRHAIAFAIGAAVLSTIFVFAIQAAGMPVLTSSFVFATWIILAARDRMAKQAIPS
jgi:urea transporter